MKEIAWAIIVILQVLEHLLEGTKADARSFSAEVTDHKTALLRKYGYDPIPVQEPLEGSLPTRMNGET